METIEFSPDSDKELIKIQGTIVPAGGLLHLKLQNIISDVNQELTLRITTIDGKIISTHHINSSELNKIISLPIGQFSSGMYFISLFAEDNILDTEKFLVK